MISIIIPVRNREEIFFRCIDSVVGEIKKIKVASEIVIIADRCSRRNIDKINDLRKRNSIIKVIFNLKKLNISQLRNLGVRKSNGDIIVFIDSDCVARKNWLKNLVFPLLYNGYEASGGYYYLDGKKLSNWFSTANFAIKKKTLFKIGMFDTWMPTHEDVDLFLRLRKKGIVIYESKDSYVDHYREYGIEHLSKHPNKGVWYYYYHAKNKNLFSLVFSMVKDLISPFLSLNVTRIRYVITGSFLAMLKKLIS